MFGYMSSKEALEAGFTHHGEYYGIPLWMAPDNPDFPIATKWAPMEYLMTVFHYIEGFIRSIVYQDEFPCFQFWIGKEITDKPE